LPRLGSPGGRDTRAHPARGLRLPRRRARGGGASHRVSLSALELLHGRRAGGRRARAGARRGGPEARVSLLGGLLAALNRLPVGERAVRVDGDRLYAASPDRLLAALAWKTGLRERAERRLIAREVKPGMVAVDVGANLGVHTLALARAVGPAGRVHALEPDPANFRLLARAVTEARGAQVTLHRAAAAAQAGEMDPHLSAVHRGDHRLHPEAARRTRLRVPVVVLDELLAGEPHVASSRSTCRWPRSRSCAASSAPSHAIRRSACSAS